MAYDPAGICLHVEETLRVAPCTPLARVSQALGVDRHTIERAIRLERGKSFRELRRELLCFRARQLLVGRPAASIKEISYLLGFHSPQAFARFTKRVCGRCPAELRRRAHWDEAGQNRRRPLPPPDILVLKEVSQIVPICSKRHRVFS